MTDRPIRAILDASAIVRYVRGGDSAIHIGETLLQIADDGVAGLPVLCMAQASHELGDSAADKLQLLQDHPATELLAGPVDWRAVAALMPILKRWDAVIPAMLALDFEVAVLSADPGLYVGIDDPYLIVAV